MNQHTICITTKPTETINYQLLEENYISESKKIKNCSFCSFCSITVGKLFKVSPIQNMPGDDVMFNLDQKDSHYHENQKLLRNLYQNKNQLIKCNEKIGWQNSSADCKQWYFMKQNNSVYIANCCCTHKSKNDDICQRCKSMKEQRISQCLKCSNPIICSQELTQQFWFYFFQEKSENYQFIEEHQVVKCIFCENEYCELHRSYLPLLKSKQVELSYCVQGYLKQLKTFYLCDILLLLWILIEFNWPMILFPYSIFIFGFYKLLFAFIPLQIITSTIALPKIIRYCCFFLYYGSPNQIKQLFQFIQFMIINYQLQQGGLESLEEEWLSMLFYFFCLFLYYLMDLQYLSLNCIF